jgi:hypothetical protein
MTKNKLELLDDYLLKYSNINSLVYIKPKHTQTSSNITSEYKIVNLDYLLSFVKGDNIKAISTYGITKNIFGYLIDCHIVDINEFELILCVPNKYNRRYMTLSSLKYTFYFKRKIHKNSSKRDLFLSFINGT